MIPIFITKSISSCLISNEEKVTNTKQNKRVESDRQHKFTHCFLLYIHKHKYI